MATLLLQIQVTSVIYYFAWKKNFFFLIFLEKHFTLLILLLPTDAAESHWLAMYSPCLKDTIGRFVSKSPGWGSVMDIAVRERERERKKRGIGNKDKEKWPVVGARGNEL